MCGIVGFIDFDKQSTEGYLKKMNDTLHHRGPDGEGLFFEQTSNCSIGLGHKRLSIIDLTESGKQPQVYNQFTITYNGEIYNYQEIKVELVAIGHSFIGNSDTEVILHAFAEWGTACVQKFIGMFAFVIYDNNESKLYCFRDRAGVKPFFYYRQNALFFFSSELKAFHQHPGFDKKLNLDAAAAFIQLGYVPTPHCIFDNCHKLPPGHFLVLDLKTQTKKITQYWNVYDAYNSPELDISYEEAKAETKRLLISACNYRMVSDVPVGVFLSGGYDSSALTAILQSTATEKIKTFTIGMPDIGLNEAPYAKQVAEHLGTDHTELMCTEKNALEIIPDLPYYYDEPFADSSAIPTILVSRLARKDVTVALSADAGDEIFAGYNRYDYIVKYGKKIQQLPKPLRSLMAATMGKIPSDKIPYFKNKYLFHSRYDKIKSFLKDASPYNINLVLSRQFDNEEIQRLFKKNVTKLKTYFDSEELRAEKRDTLSYALAIDYQTYLMDDIMQKVDRAGMSTSLEGREPFLDHRLIEWAAKLPLAYKYKDGIKKRILRDITHEYLPKEIMDRKKMGFGIPLGEWLAGPLKDLAMNYLSKSFIERQGIFNYEELNQLTSRFFDGYKEKAEKIWFILMFQMWYEKWM